MKVVTSQVIATVILAAGVTAAATVDVDKLGRLNVEISKDLPVHLCNQTLSNLEVGMKLLNMHIFLFIVKKRFLDSKIFQTLLKLTL